MARLARSGSDSAQEELFPTYENETDAQQTEQKNGSWSGAELGQIALRNTAIAYANEKRPPNEREELPVSDEDFREMLKNLTDQKESEIYQRYGLIHQWLTINTILKAGHLQKAEFHVFKLLNFIELARKAEDIDNCLEDPNKGPIAKIVNTFSLQSFFPTGTQNKNNVETVELSRKELLAEVYFVLGYNKAIDLIASVHGPKELKLLKAQTGYITDQVEKLKHLTIDLYHRIKESEYNDPELKEKKLKVLRDLFKPIDIKKLKIPAKNIEQVKKDLKDFNAFMDPSLDPNIKLTKYDQNEQSSDLFIDLDNTVETTKREEEE